MVGNTWQDARGDETLALDWSINEDSLVMEIGGYEGRWAAQMVEKFNPYMHIFEPQVWLSDRLEQRFSSNRKVQVHPFGLWTHDTTLRLWEHGTDGASVIRNDGRTSEVCEFRDAIRYMDNIDVCLMNIERAEFVLIPYLLGLGLMNNFRFFWCQFHPGSGVLDNIKTERIFDGMGRTHEILWDYYPTAVAWERR